MRHIFRFVAMEISFEPNKYNCVYSCSDIPDAFLDKVIAKRHFSQFGKIRNFILRPSKRSCIVEYELSDEAETALLDAGTYNGESFDVEYTTKNCPQPMPVDELDPDVRYELDAMAGKRTPSYSTTPRAAGKIYGSRASESVLTWRFLFGFQ